jgi:hypothetical protein
MDNEVNIENLMRLTETGKPKRDQYYQDTFQAMLNGKKYVWNWPAALFGPMWLTYRKAYGSALILLAISGLLGGAITFLTVYISFILANGNKDTLLFFIVTSSVLTGLAVIVLQGYMGNVLYLRSLKRKISHQYQKANLKNIDKLSIFLLLILQFICCIIKEIGEGIPILILSLLIGLTIFLRILNDRRKVRKVLQNSNI